ncbi:MAG: cytochrome P450 [Patulibacter sp.]
MIESRPEAIARPFALYQDMLALEEPYRWGPTVVVSRMSDIRMILKDHRRFSNRAHAVGSRPEARRAAMQPHEQAAFDEVTEFEELIISRTDGAQHARLRSIVQRAFTPRKIAMLGDETQAFTTALFDRMVERGETNIAASVTQELPVMMICSLLNVDQAEAPLIQGWSAKIGKNRGAAVVADLMGAHEALKEFRAYVIEKIEHHRRFPDSTNLVSTLMGASDDERLSEDELVAMVLILLFAGADTTKALLGNGTLALLSDQAQWERFRDDPDEAVAGLTEELIRFVSPVQTLWRVTTEPVTLHGVEIEAGTTILLLMGAASRDPSLFEDPDRLDIDRTESRDHISFGHGTHFCLGTSLARMECGAYFTELATRFPDVRLAQDPEAVEWGGNIQFRCITGLEVDLGEERRR